VGVGCEDWPQCYAQLQLETEHRGITVLTGAGQDMAHYGARVTHRYIASTLGLFIIVIFVLCVRQGPSRASGVLLPTAILSVTIFLSLLGYYTPTRSNPLITMGNLLGGMSLLGLLWWLMQREMATHGLSVPDKAGVYRPLAFFALALIVMQIVLGGWSSANYASANCPDLLTCPGNLLASTSVEDAFNPLREIALDSNGKVIRSESLGVLSMAHRLFALVTAAYLAWLVRKLKPEPGLTGTVIALSIFSIGQIVVGVSMIWWELPLLLVTLHNSLAAGLLLGSINLLHRLTPPTGSPLPG
jgi:cytochrome c oxidase assembly protein subunit 15